MPPRKRKQDKSEASASDIDPAKMKVAELRAELEQRGLDTSGKKAELVARLEAALGDPGPSKKTKVEEGEGGVDESDFSKAVRALKSAEPKKKRGAKVDSHVPMAGRYTVEGDWDCMLNQTNIGQNNNKYYVIQMLRNKGTNRLHVWNRWGRVGEPGQNAMKGPFSTVDKAAADFCKKFHDKTKNAWEDRTSFTPVPGKYTLIEMDDEDSQEAAAAVSFSRDEPDAPPKKMKACSLEKSTQELVKLIFNNDMFQDAMKSMDIDTKKMPLGKLSKVQIAKGFEALEAIEEAQKSSAPRGRLAELSSKFYTIIPHDFGRRVPPVISDPETLQQKFDMLLVLGDIEIAQGLQRAKEKKEQEVAGEEVPHPLDINYELLKAKLRLLEKGEPEFKVIEKYLKATEGTWRRPKILDVWSVDREEEGTRFSKHNDIGNRRLLWHGTKVAVVAAILKSGMRIMPHAGGRVGKGLYFASENSKSAGYVGCAGRIGIMFLNEVALGNEHSITAGDSSLTAAPKGFDSIVARGVTEPDSKLDTEILLEGKKVTVPQGKPIPQRQYSHSHFSQSEYLIYRESQARIRYLLKLEF